MTEKEKLDQITAVKDCIDVDAESVFDEGYRIGYIHGVDDAVVRVLEIIDEEQEDRLKRSYMFPRAARDALECLADRAKGLRGEE